MFARARRYKDTLCARVVVRAFVVTGPRQSEVQEVEAPIAQTGSVVVDVARVGVCGTDVEFFTGEMAYLHQGHASYPIRLGHEWCGTVAQIGPDVDSSWLGRRVTGDTMLGCGECARCLDGRHHVCRNRFEVGIRGGFHGALAEQLTVPASSLHALPESLDDAAGAMVEPGANALRAAWAADVAAGDRALVLGPGTIGLLAAEFLRSRQVEVHLAGRTPESMSMTRDLGFTNVWSVDQVPVLPFDAVIDATNAATLPAWALELVEPAKRVVYIGLSGTPSTIDTRELVLKDVTAVGILSGSAGLDGAIEEYAAGRVDPRPLVAAAVGLGEVHDVLSGWRPADAGAGPKLHVDPRR
jgi:threonine dehydrogenase-like Zn-dependent dehydrogenase